MTLDKMQELIEDMRSGLSKFARDFDQYNNNILALCDKLDDELNDMQEKIEETK